MTCPMQQRNGEQFDVMRAREYPPATTTKTKLKVPIKHPPMGVLSKIQVTQRETQDDKQGTDFWKGLPIREPHKRWQILLMFNPFVTANKESINP